MLKRPAGEARVRRWTSAVINNRPHKQAVHKTLTTKPSSKDQSKLHAHTHLYYYPFEEAPLIKSLMQQIFNASMNTQKYD